MATRYRFGDSEYPHLITFAVVNWIDALSRPAANWRNRVGWRHFISNVNLSMFSVDTSSEF